MFGKFFDRNKTFKPKKKLEKGTRRYELHKMAKATLGSGDLKAAVELPPGEDMNEWLAVHTVDFYNTTNLLYGSITEYCSPAECPTMSAGPRYEYLWADGVTIKKPIKVSAQEYVDYLMTWIENQINAENLFPSSPDVPFPKNFVSMALGEEAHLNTAFKHFMLFVFEFELVDKKELQPLKDLIDELLGVQV